MSTEKTPNELSLSEFAEKHCVIKTPDGSTTPLILRPWQKAALEYLEKLPKNHAIIINARRHH